LELRVGNHSLQQGANPVSKKREKGQKEVIGLIGVGLDNKDGHKRVTESEYFLLLGGSEATHERMQDTVVKFTEALHRRGKRLPDASAEEVIDLLRESSDD
jgi:hypothetical protein